MGGPSFDPKHWATYSATKVTGKATHTVFSARGLRESLDPMKMKNMLRESCDDASSPASTAIIVGLDETGSMHIIPDYMVREGLPKLFQEIYDRKPVSDPQILFLGLGDTECDMHPIQVSQFEAGMRIADQLTDIYLEGNGGGNHYEGYTMAWYVAAMHTKIDCFLKRGTKGFLFTVGDEEPNPVLYRKDIIRHLGLGPETDLTARQLLDTVSQQYHVFHVIVEQGSYAAHHLDSVVTKWSELLGQNALRLSDYTKLSEVIVSAIDVTAGTSVDDVVKSWSGDTSLVVAKAIGGLIKAGGQPGSDGVMRL
jgi:hypothetical protein